MIEIIVFGGKPEAANRDDFGALEDFGLQLRLKGFDYNAYIPVDADYFGVFLGRSSEGWTVAVKDLLTWDVTQYRVYPHSRN